MSLTKKINQAYKNTIDFLAKNKKAIALGTALTFTPVAATATNTTQDKQQPKTEQTEKLDILLKNYSHFKAGDYQALSGALIENLYPASSHTISPDTIKPIKFIDDSVFFGIQMTGYNFHTDKQITGIFQDEHERNQSTTYSSMCNQGGCTPEQLKEIISISNKIPREHISILYKDNDEKRFLSAVYTGPEERTDVRDRVIVNPEQSVIHNHINWQRGKTAYVHPEVAFRLMGQDFRKAERIVQDYTSLENQINQRDQIQRDLEAQRDTLKTQRESLETERDTLKTQKEKAIQERDSLDYQAQTRRRTTGGVGGFVASQKPFNEDVNVSYALKTGREFGDSRREIYIIGVYNPGRTNQEIIQQDSDMIIEPIPGTNLSALSRYEIDHTKSTTATGTTGAIGMEVLGNLSLIGGINFTEKNITEKFRHMNETYFVGGDGVPINPDRWEIIEDNTTRKKEFGPVAGLGYDFGRLSVKGLYNFKQNELGIGVLYNIRNRRDQPRPNQINNTYNNGGEQ